MKNITGKILECSSCGNQWLHEKNSKSTACGFCKTRPINTKLSKANKTGIFTSKRTLRVKTPIPKIELTGFLLSTLQ